MRIGYNTWSMATVPYQTFIPGAERHRLHGHRHQRRAGLHDRRPYVANAADSGRAVGRRPPAASSRRSSERDLQLPSLIGNQSLVEVDADRNAAAMKRLRDTIDLCVDLTLDAADGADAQHRHRRTLGRSGSASSSMVLDRLGALADYAATARRGDLHRAARRRRGRHARARGVAGPGTIDSPALRLDFDVSHFEVVGYADGARRSPRLAPLAGAAEIKDQHFRYLSSLRRQRAAPTAGWWKATASAARRRPTGGRSSSSSCSAARGRSICRRI